MVMNLFSYSFCYAIYFKEPFRPSFPFNRDDAPEGPVVPGRSGVLGLNVKKHEVFPHRLSPYAASETTHVEISTFRIH